MITIRYAELPEGLHAQARADGRRTIIYLRPGLTPEQRRRSLRRARQSARMGHGPRLPAPGVALAVAGDIAGVTLRNLATAARRRPLGAALLATALGVLLACYPLFVAGSVTFTAGQPPPAHRLTGGAPGQRGGAPGTGGGGPPGNRPGAAQPRQGAPAGPSPGRGPSPPASATPPPPGSPSPSRDPSPSPSPSRDPSPSPPGGPSPSPGEDCLNVGPYGICLPV